ncbi:MAG: ADP-ribosyltransferase [Actinomycetaceae bacterium]|nr:hypothetical protein [Arcanobacterium sp.]MDD7505561.1 ADP-ribosyltransferase [Actinomycetaceae bacterium]
MDRQPLDEFTAVQRALVKEARSKLLNTYSMFKDKDPAVLRQILARKYVKLVNEYGDAVAAQAAAMYEQLRPGSLGLFTAEVADQYTEKQLTAKAIEITRAADPIKSASGELQKALVGMGRRTIKHNMRRDKVKPHWARVPAGAKTCAFCTMLASRGWVYSDEETAGGAGNRFHTDCDCMIVPSWDKGTPKLAGYDPDGMYEQYKAARETAEADVEAGKAKRVDESLILKKMREKGQGTLSDALMPPNKTKRFQKWCEHSLDKATDDELEALRVWTTDKHSDLQEALRFDRMTPELDALASKIDSALERNPLPLDVQLHRRDSLARFGLARIDDADSIIGGTYDSPGYLALTTIKDGIDVTGDSEVRVHIDVPQGTPAAYLESITEYKDQQETLVIRSRSGTITRVEISNGSLHVWVQLE